jgi:uncharacterized protein (DUF305 family)
VVRVKISRMHRVLAASLLLVLAGSGCQGSETGAQSSATSPTAPVIQPGRPGEPNTSLTGTAALPRAKGEPDPDDVRFMQEMIVHHAQAIQMVRLAKPNLTDRQVRAIASRIEDEQDPEIDGMARWLEQHDEDVPPQAENPLISDGHDHDGMAGMATPERLDELGAARGVESDRLFLTLMTAHHEGAITMAVEQHRSGTDERVAEIGDEITVTQQVQINQMQGMLERLG